jgi:hypothetical protein
MIYNSEDVFAADKYPEMAKELKMLKDAAGQIPVYFKGEIIISYLKKRSIKSEWIKANPELVTFMCDYSSKTTHIESLFDFYRLKQVTLNSYEKYIRNFFLAT